MPMESGDRVGEEHGSPLARAAGAVAAQLGDPGFVTGPCRRGSHDCRFRLCRCPGHETVPPGQTCALAPGAGT